LHPGLNKDQPATQKTTDGAIKMAVLGMLTVNIGQYRPFMSMDRVLGLTSGGAHDARAYVVCYEKIKSRVTNVNKNAPGALYAGYPPISPDII
jgi:hypothetical protein